MRSKRPSTSCLSARLACQCSRSSQLLAVVDGGAAEVVNNPDVVECAGISREYIDAPVKRELEEIDRRRRVYLQGRDMNACTQGVSEEHVALPRPYPRLAWISTDRD